MRVSMMLAWYDEPAWQLAQCVTSATVIGDRIFAADGAYQQVRDRAEESPPEQRAAIEEAAEEAGIEVVFLAPRIWAGQVQKRNALLAAATRDLRVDDWVIPLDADWVLHGNRKAVRADIRRYTTAEQFSVRFHQTNNPRRNIKLEAPHQWHRDYNSKTRWEPLLFRAMSDMRLSKSHWDYSGVRRDGVRIGFSGGARNWQPAVSRCLRSEFLIEHRCMFRDDKQLHRNRDFCRVRDAEKKRTGAER